MVCLLDKAERKQVTPNRINIKSSTYVSSSDNVLVAVEFADDRADYAVVARVAGQEAELGPNIGIEIQIQKNNELLLRPFNCQALPVLVIIDLNFAIDENFTTR